EKDGLIINVRYPSSFDDPYLRPEILLEIGPLASWLPYGEYAVQSFASEEFPALFTNPICNVKAIVAERTFWEKATILHQEANRPLDKAMLPRYSRHYYDLAMMAQSHVKEAALRDLNLLETVVAFKQQFYPSAWANYESAKAGSLKLVPPQERITELTKDYDAMRSMIFGNYPSLNEIITILKALEAEIN
ncbi:MAG: nucleotidyl transferase AbiEii/AbiGii toxin family protein, partial [Sulfuricurvum sp.]